MAQRSSSSFYLPHDNNCAKTTGPDTVKRAIRGEQHQRRERGEVCLWRKFLFFLRIVPNGLPDLVATLAPSLHQFVECARVWASSHCCRCCCCCSCSCCAVVVVAAVAVVAAVVVAAAVVVVGSCWPLAKLLLILVAALLCTMTTLAVSRCCKHSIPNVSFLLTFSLSRSFCWPRP